MQCNRAHTGIGVLLWSYRASNQNICPHTLAKRLLKYLRIMVAPKAVSDEKQTSLLVNEREEHRFTPFLAIVVTVVVVELFDCPREFNKFSLRHGGGV